MVLFAFVRAFGFETGGADDADQGAEAVSSVLGVGEDVAALLGVDAGDAVSVVSLCVRVVCPSDS
jgi:hypothetical protein